MYVITTDRVPVTMQSSAQLLSPVGHMRGASDRAAERYSPSLERAPGSLSGSSQNYSARTATQNRVVRLAATYRDRPTRYGFCISD